MNKNKATNLKFLIIIMMLIIILLLLLLFTNFGKIENNNYLLPTGNIDVFDINVKCRCTIDKDRKICEYIDKNGDRVIIPTIQDSTDKIVNDEVYVDDKNGNYIYQRNLKIFTNSAYKYTNKIAPGVSNTYNFVVHNGIDSKLKYNIAMYEETEYFINMKYRLRKNNEYIIGDDQNWVSASELKTEANKIKAGFSDSYSLDWRWMYEDNQDSLDSLAGEKMTSAYKLNIRFYFEQDDD